MYGFFRYGRLTIRYQGDFELAHKEKGDTLRPRLSRMRQPAQVMAFLARAFRLDVPEPQLEQHGAHAQKHGRKAKEMMEGSANNFIGSRTAPIGNNLAANNAVADVEASKPQSAVTPDAEIASQTTAWGAAWASRDIKSYLAFYASDFNPEKGLSREAWARQREQRINRTSDVRIEIQDLVVRSNSPDAAVAGFRQIYSAGAFGETTDKEVEWRKIGGQWKIVRESTRPRAKGE